MTKEQFFIQEKNRILANLELAKSHGDSEWIESIEMDLKIHLDMDPFDFFQKSLEMARYEKWEADKNLSFLLSLKDD